ncbi:uncharacterized protein LOC119632060 [Glossina fuscipes]|uniref:Uncharacterized protein LOC119632060 n=1 Tax=Glossina fuscipes TaxID=7396 RepID=A0A8U0W6G2_9MUSC|nr:uncharacterized protein LOC119632060 [Glossina fuscipes]
MGQIEESKRKPRRTRGTPSYYYRNRFAAASIAIGSSIFALFYLTPVFQVANEKLNKSLLVVTEEEKDRKFTFNLGAIPRTSEGIQKNIDETKELFSQR